MNNHPTLPKGKEIYGASDRESTIIFLAMLLFAFVVFAGIFYIGYATGVRSATSNIEATNADSQ